MSDHQYLPKVSKFDFEQHIFDTWSIIKDLDMLFEYICEVPKEDIDPDKICNIILGMKQMGDLRFNKLLDMFENLVYHSRFL